MLFNSYEFIFVFLPVCLVIFFSASKLNKSLAVIWLVLSSLFFYGWRNVYYVPLLVASVCINYFISKKINDGTAKRFWLILGISTNVTVLCICKYINVLPLGISFFTFAQTAYIVNTFKGTAKPEGFLSYAEYVTFFGYITSGPIADYREMIPQFRSAGTPDYEMIAQGITLFALGLFKKVYIADSLASFVNGLFAQAELLTFFEAWTAALGYSMHLYFDFSGYSDMAIAVGFMFGLKLPDNFNSPYKSTSIIDFWRRWHMSLGAWVKEYIYIPLGGSREGDLKRTRNVILAMLLTGLWHGLGWTFVLWGMIHGVMLAVNHQWRRLGFRLPAVIAWGVTFTCVVLCWVIFRAESLGSAVHMLGTMTGLKGFPLEGLRVGSKKLILALTLITVFTPNTKDILRRFRPGILWLVLTLMLFVMAFMNFSGVSDFLYFQF